MFILPAEVTLALNTLNGYESYVVGGAVRDLLLGNEVSDYDITTNAPFEVIRDLFKDFKQYSASNFRHNTLGVKIGGYQIEISPFKGKDILEDYLHRDFTINALAYNEKLIGIEGGLDDLKNKIIKTTTAPEIIFNEDPIRILRALRFSINLGFKIEDNTKKAMFKLKDLLADMPYERINQEFSKIIVHPKAYLYLQEYREIIASFIPEIRVMFDFNQRSKYHQHDLYTHTLLVLKEVECDLTVKLAAFFHDIGKVEAKTCDKVYGDMIYHYPMHPEKSVEIAGPILKRLKYSANRIKDVLHLIELHDYGFSYKISNTRRLLYLLGVNYEELFPKLLNLKNADYIDHINLEHLIIDLNRVRDNYDTIISNNDCFQIKNLKINGLDLIELGYPKTDVKRALDKTIRLVMKDIVKNDKEVLINYLKDNKEIILGGK